MTGTIELLPAGSFGVDYSFGRPSIADMQTLETRFASRYICIDNPLTHGKLVTIDEVRRLADAGILMMINYEQGESTTFGGETAGRKHGKVAADWRHYLQMPADLAIVISTDVGVTSSQYPAISDFCAAFMEESGGPVGHYHGTILCAHLEARGLNDLTWMAMATSWSPGGETAAVHVRQKGYVLGVCDANYVRKPTPFWNYNGEPLPPPPPPPPPIERADMPMYVISYGAIPGLEDGGVYELDGGGRRHVTSDEWHQVLKGVAQNADGSWPSHEFWQPLAHVANGWVLTGMSAPSSGSAGLTEDDVKRVVNSTSLTVG